MPVTHDLCVSTGKYVDKEGKEKTRWQKIGSIVQKEDGGRYMMLSRWFNPAGLPNPDNMDVCFVSMFSKEKTHKKELPGSDRTRSAAAVEGLRQLAAFTGPDDDNPF